MFSPGNKCKVTLGANTIVGVGTWEFTGVAADLLETTAMGDTAKQFMTGLVDYGGFNLTGLYDKLDTNGQLILDSANKNNSKIGDIRFYVDSVSYYIPDTGAVTAAGALIQSVAITADKGSIMQIRVSGKFTGPTKLA